MPKDTNEMYWDYRKHLYILNIEHVKNELGIDLNRKIWFSNKSER